MTMLGIIIALGDVRICLYPAGYPANPKEPLPFARVVHDVAMHVIHIGTIKGRTP